MQYTSIHVESQEWRVTRKSISFSRPVTERSFRIGWKSGGCRSGSDVAGRGGEGGADRSACKRFPAPLRGVRGVRTYRCTDRGALRGAIPFSRHVQPMMRLLLSRASLSPFTISRPLSVSLSLRSLGARARASSIRLFLALSPILSPSIPIASSQQGNNEKSGG